jgi:hypothetical protein
MAEGIVAKETLESELKRLKQDQRKMREDEVFLGLTPAERAVFNEKLARISSLEIKIQTMASAEEKARSFKAEQRGRWNQSAETDASQTEARQSYRNRETESSNMEKRATEKSPEQRKRPRY